MRCLKSLAVALLIPLSLSAQEPVAQDSSPFHAGQWAMQFGGGSSLFSLGVLRFTSARSAWLLDVATNGSFLNAENTDNTGTTTSADQQVINVNLRLGRRFYQTPRRRIVSFQTLAVEGGFNDQMIDLPVGSVRRTSTNAGVNAELGGSYMLTSGVSVGGTALISAGYLKFKQRDPFARMEGDGWYVNGISVLFALGIYF